MLVTLIALLAAATIAVPLTRGSGLGSVPGYLIAGLAIGPAGPRLVTDVDRSPISPFTDIFFSCGTVYCLESPQFTTRMDSFTHDRQPAA